MSALGGGRTSGEVYREGAAVSRGRPRTTAPTEVQQAHTGPCAGYNCRDQ